MCEVGDHGVVMSLAIEPEGAAEEQQIGEERVTSGFLVEGFLVVGERERLHERNSERSSSVK